MSLTACKIEVWKVEGHRLHGSQNQGLTTATLPCCIVEVCMRWCGDNQLLRPLQCG